MSKKLAKTVAGRPGLRNLETLLNVLDVRFEGLASCTVGPGFRLELKATKYPSIHYNLSGHGKMCIGDREVVDLQPHMLILVPSLLPFAIEVAHESDRARKLKTVKGGDLLEKERDVVQLFAGEDGHRSLEWMCGIFSASIAHSIALFEDLNVAVVEKFGEDDQLGVRLKTAMAEFRSSEVGADMMATTLLKQMVILLLRRSLPSSALFAQRFAKLQNQHIVQVLAAIAADPGAPHTTNSLAQIADMGRSTFVATFTRVIGHSPMATLRDFRMRQALHLLKSSHLSIDAIGRSCGYHSKGSFFRAFNKIYHKLPGKYWQER